MGFDAPFGAYPKPVGTRAFSRAAAGEDVRMKMCQGPACVAPKLASLPSAPATIAPDARDIDPAGVPAGTVAYMDPPYLNTTGYGHDLGRDEVCALAERWASAGALVCISEAEPIEELGWHSVEITSQRAGQKRTFGGTREWLTMSAPPKWKPAVQTTMFGPVPVDTGRAKR
jgi:hypothetical protein